MFILFKFVFHIICAIGRFFRKIGQIILGRRHEEPGLLTSKTEPVTLEHIRIISDMENDTYRPLPSFSLAPKGPSNEWNSWGREDIFRQKAVPVEKPEESVDYFSDIAATIKKTPKIVIKKRSNDYEIPSQGNISYHNRLQMNNDDSVEFQPGLTEWNENETNSSSMTGGTWDDQDDFNGLSQEATEALRETRRIEREKKLREHQQRKLEKEAMRQYGLKRESLSS